MAKGGGTPDYTGAAEAEAEANRDTARDTTYADRPNQFNPLGNLVWEPSMAIDPATGKQVTTWNQIQNLSPDMQGLFDTKMDEIQRKQDMSSGMMDRVLSELGPAPDWEQFGRGIDLEYDPTQLRGRAEEAMYNKATSRLDPRFEQEGEAIDVRLRNQGLRPGDQAWDASMGNYGRYKTDAYNQALWSSVGEGRQEAGQLWEQQVGATDYANALRQQDIAEYEKRRTFSLGEAERLSPMDDIQGLIDMLGGGA